MPKILCISATSRPDNYTAMALGVVRDTLSNMGLRVHFLDGRELDLAFPGHPETEGTSALQTAVAAADGIVFATPEYHGTFSSYCKLVIENLGFPSQLKGKAVAILGVAAGRIGAIKSIESLRGSLAHTGAIVMPGAVSIAGVRNAFSGDGSCSDEDTRASLEHLAKGLVTFAEHYVCPKQILEEMVRKGDAQPWSSEH